MKTKMGLAKRGACFLAVLLFSGMLAAQSDSTVLAGSRPSPRIGGTVTICSTVTLKVRAGHWIWVPKKRRVNGRQLIVRRHGRIVYVRVHAAYRRAKDGIRCISDLLAVRIAQPENVALSAGLAAGETVTGPQPVAGRPPAVSGIPQYGKILSASPGSWTESPTSYTYEWRRCDSLAAKCHPISGASAPTHLLASADVGSTLRVRVTASNAAGQSAPADSSPTAVVTDAAGIEHLEYVFDDGLISVYDADHDYGLVNTISLPQTEAGIRGVSVAPASHMLFISYGGDGVNFNGSVLAYDLVAERVVWTTHLETGIDSGQVSPDGKRLYMPTGENSPSGIWNVLDTTNGTVIGTIQGGAGAHNTVASSDGRYVYLGGRNYNYLDVYETNTGSVRSVGPLIGGVRPFTVNGSNTLAFTTATDFDGFQVSSVTTGHVLFTVSFGPVSSGFSFTAPSHGISMSPDEKQLYVVDSVDKEVLAYDVSKAAEGVAPTQLGAIPVAGLSGTESPCAYDCGRDGWLQRSIDGRFVYVGDSGEVVETGTLKVVATLPALLNTRKSLEIDWSGGVPVASSERTGTGQVG
jgi:WD40 repeat protein